MGRKTPETMSLKTLVPVRAMFLRRVKSPGIFHVLLMINRMVCLCYPLFSLNVKNDGKRVVHDWKRHLGCLDQGPEVIGRAESLRRRLESG